MHRLPLSAVLAVAALGLACAHRHPVSPVSAPATPVSAETSSPREGVESGVTRLGISWEEEGEGNPVVLLHAFSVDRRMWDAQVAYLKRSYRVLRYDLRAHGKSASVGESYSAIDDLKELLDERGITKAALVGLSNGSRVALDFTLAHPERVARLVLASPWISGYKPQESMAWMSPVLAAARTGDAEKAATLWAETPLMSIPGDPAATATVKRLTQDNRSLWLLPQNTERLLEPPALGRLAEVKIPVLLIEGEKDLPDTHHVADALIAGIPSAQRLVVPGVGHLVNLAAPKAFNGALTRFLE
jgi:pimeloyl-ACP methyl ester carboxylesterase